MGGDTDNHIITVTKYKGKDPLAKLCLSDTECTFRSIRDQSYDLWAKDRIARSCCRTRKLWNAGNLPKGTQRLMFLDAAPPVPVPRASKDPKSVVSDSHSPKKPNGVVRQQHPEVFCFSPIGYTR